MQTLFADEGITVTNDNATHTIDSHGATIYADFVELGGLEGTSAVFFMDGNTPISCSTALSATDRTATCSI